MNVNTLIEGAIATLVAVAWKIVGAVVLWLVGRWLIAFAMRLLGRALDGERNYDAGCSLVRKLRFLEKLDEDLDDALELLHEQAAR